MTTILALGLFILEFLVDAVMYFALREIVSIWQPMTWFIEWMISIPTILFAIVFKFKFKPGKLKNDFLISLIPMILVSYGITVIVDKFVSEELIAVINILIIVPLAMVSKFELQKLNIKEFAIAVVELFSSAGFIAIFVKELGIEIPTDYVLLATLLIVETMEWPKKKGS